MAAYRAASIVLLGKFNPAIFHPEWFRKHDLLPEVETEAGLALTNRILVTNDFTSVTFESVKVEVLAERFFVSTQRVDWFSDLGGLVASIFELLSHTPAERMAANFTDHFPKEVASADEVVKTWLPLEPLAKAAGLPPMMLGGHVAADWEGYRVALALEPSLQLKGGTFLNQNYERRVKRVSEVTQSLRDDWKKLMSRSSEVRHTILPKVAER